MVLSINYRNHGRTNYFTWKYIFITLLIFNTLLGCVYYINEQKNQEILQNTSAWHSKLHQQPLNAIQFIQNTLSKEYNHDHLNQFYHHVEKEYSLGLKCTRKSNATKSILKNPPNR